MIKVDTHGGDLRIGRGRLQCKKREGGKITYYSIDEFIKQGEQPTDQYIFTALPVEHNTYRPPKIS